MNRTEKITGACMALLAAAAIGQFYLDKGTVPQPEQAKAETKETAPKQPEPKTPGVDEVVSAGLTSFEEKDAAGRLVTLGAIVEELESQTYASAKLSSGTSEALAKAAFAELGQEGVERDEAGVLGRLSGIIASRTFGEQPKAYVLKVIGEGPEGLRSAVLKGVGRGGVGGKEVFEAVHGLAKTGGIQAGPMAGALRRTGGKKSAEPLIELMKGTNDWKAIGSIVIAIQDLQDPSHMGAIIERLEQVGLLDKPKMMPYVSGKLLAKHLETAEGSVLSRGIKVLWARPGFVSANAGIVVKGLDSPDAETRRRAAMAVREAVVRKSLDPLKAQEMLAGRIDRETEPVLRAELTGSMDQVRRVLDEKPAETKQ